MTGNAVIENGDWWGELAVCALFGTDRRPMRLDLLPPELAALAARFSADAAGNLLDTSALAVSYRRGGFRSEVVAQAPEPAEAEERPLVSRRAGAQLAELLVGTDLELIEYWCLTAAQAGQLAPEVCLPRLLDLAVRQPVLRPAISGVLGRRSRWLAGQQPRWAKVVPEESPARPGPNPPAEVPDEAVLDRMRSRIKSFVRIERGRLRRRLVVNVPEQLDPDAPADGITDDRPGTRMSPQLRRQWWLEQIVAATPLNTWNRLFDTPEQAVATRFDDDWQTPIQAGWAAAAVRQQNQDWARALLLGSGARHRVEQLLRLLQGTERDQALMARIHRLDPREIDVLVRYLGVLETPWPEPVAAGVLAWIEARMGQMHPMAARNLLNLISYRCPIEAGQAVVDLALDRPPEDTWRSSLLGVARTLSTRARIHQELQ